MSNDLTKFLLASSKNPNTTATTLLATLTHYLTTLPTAPLSSRPPASTTLADTLYPLLSRTRLATLLPTGPSASPLTPLFFLALFSRRSSLLPLLPPSASEELQALIEEALEAGGEVVRGEVEVLVRQLGALGECCRAEEDAGAACGCAGVGGKGAEMG